MSASATARLLRRPVDVVHAGAVGRSAGLARVGLGIIGFYAFVAIAAPWLAPYDPNAYLARPLQLPSSTHLLGTNDVGQDVLSDLIYGARASLLVGILAAALTLGLSTLVGATAGYVGGLLDSCLMRLVDVLIALPRLPLMIVISAYAGASLQTTVLVIGLLCWPNAARVIRSQVLSLRARPHVEAARLFGGGNLYVIRRHVLPAIGPILVAGFVGQAGHAVLLEANLAFLGLGDPALKSWGLSIRHAVSVKGFFFGSQWLWSVLPAGLNLVLLLLGFTFVGVGLEALSNPRLRRHR